MTQQSVGLGLKHEFFEDILIQPDFKIDFLAVQPEHWLGYGGRLGRELRTLSERYAFNCRSFSVDLGGLRPLDEQYLGLLKDFLTLHEVQEVSETLSYCGDESGYLHQTFPIPFTQEAVLYVAKRIRRTQDILERRIALENIMFYTMPSTELSELEFINAVVGEAQCDVVLNLSHLASNSTYFGYEPQAFINALPRESIKGYKVGMHAERELLAAAVKTHGAQPLLLESTETFDLTTLMDEVAQLSLMPSSGSVSHG